MNIPPLARSVLRIVVASYLGLCLWVYAAQHRFVFYPTRAIEATPAAAGLAYEDVELVTADGVRLHAWYVPAPSGVEKPFTLLFCHGNAGNVSHRIWSVETFHRLGMNVLLFDYRGYGRSEGRPTEAGTYADALAAWRHLIEDRSTPPERIVLFGRSLGGAVAAWLAAEVEPAALALESSFTSVADMGAQTFPFLPARLLTRIRYDTLARIDRIRAPVLIAHGPADRTVPIVHGRRLYDRARPPKTWLEFRGDHNDGGMDFDPDYRAAFADWLGALGLQAQHGLGDGEKEQ